MMPYVKMFTDMSETVDLLSDDEAGRLFKAIMHYGNGKEDKLPGQEKLIFSMLKMQIDRDAATYQDKCEKLKENGLKGGRPKKANGFDENQMVSEKTKCKEEKEKEKEEEKDKDKDKEKEERKAARRFTPPTVTEVSDYCAERNNGINADAFIDYYESKGWKIGNTPMKDWKAAVRTWEKREHADSRPQRQQQPKAVHAQQYKQREYTEEELAKASGGDNYILQLLEGKVKC